MNAVESFQSEISEQSQSFFFKYSVIIYFPVLLFDLILLNVSRDEMMHQHYLCFSFLLLYSCMKHQREEKKVYRIQVKKSTPRGTGSLYIKERGSLSPSFR